MSAEDALRALKKQAIQILLPHALSNGSPELYAGFAFEMMDRGDVDVARLLQELAGAKDFDSWFAEMQKVEPAISRQRDWFSDFYQSIRYEVRYGMRVYAAG
jgi:hypothetical protein